MIHKLDNQRSRADPGEEDQEDLYEYLIERCPSIEEKMAWVSEEERFNMKNVYRHQWKTMKFAEKHRMPIHETKVADLLRNSHHYRTKIT